MPTRRNPTYAFLLNLALRWKKMSGCKVHVHKRGVKPWAKLMQDFEAINATRSAPVTAAQSWFQTVVNTRPKEPDWREIWPSNPNVLHVVDEAHPIAQRLNEGTVRQAGVQYMVLRSLPLSDVDRRKWNECGVVWMEIPLQAEGAVSKKAVDGYMCLPRPIPRALMHT
jgi:hypothetical protein